MQAMTISRLLQLTKTEILEIRRYLQEKLPLLEAGAGEQHGVLRTLENIEVVLSRPEFRQRFKHDLHAMP